MNFTKLQGAGNDFILVETKDAERDWSQTARAMCDRHFGIGADGLLVMLPSHLADFQMRMFNPDGSEAEACGNGLRCLTKYVIDMGLADARAQEISIETIAKTKDFLSSIEERTGLLKESFKEIKSIEEDIRKRVSTVDEKSKSLIGNERRIEEVLSRFKEMDALVADIEARTNQLQSTREWLARTESRLTNLAQNSERLVKELQNLTEGEGVPSAPGVKKEGKPTTLSRESQSKVKTVLTLFEQKWTIPEICKVTKMSRGEVELILELNKN